MKVLVQVWNENINTDLLSPKYGTEGHVATVALEGNGDDLSLFYYQNWGEKRVLNPEQTAMSMAKRLCAIVDEKNIYVYRHTDSKETVEAA